MIKIENAVYPSPEQVIFAIEGMRNAYNSWSLSDSHLGCCDEGNIYSCADCPTTDDCAPCLVLGEEDKKLMRSLYVAGSDHRKFMRAMPLMVRITAPLYWWKEFDTYKVGTTSLSCSTMHTVMHKKFEYDDFSNEHLCYTLDGSYGIGSDVALEELVSHLNRLRALYLDKNSKSDKKAIWWHIIQLLPSSYNQTRNICLNYEVLANIWHARRSHKMDEWRVFCDWSTQIPYSWLFTREMEDL